MSDDNILLLPDQRQGTRWWKKSKYCCPLLFTVGVICLGIAIGVCIYKNAYHDPIDLKIMALNTWGVPGTFGSHDKEKRMEQIGAKIAKKEYDIYLLEELWMRPDHATIQKLVPEGYKMTEVYDLASKGICDGRATPTGCSGLAIISKYNFTETEFNVFSVHGDLWWFDGEFEAKKGVGRVRIEPVPNTTVDIFVTHTAASDYNAYYRQIQTKEVIEHVKKSTADFAILGGDFNIDPRMTNETTYKDLTTELRSAMQEFFVYLEELLSPKRATYGNPENTYSSSFGPQLYDYIFHRSKGWNSVVINLFEVPFLKALIKKAVPDPSPEGKNTTLLKESPVLVSLSDHEAITSHLYLFKYRW